MTDGDTRLAKAQCGRHEDTRVPSIAAAASSSYDAILSLADGWWPALVVLIYNANIRAPQL